MPQYILRLSGSVNRYAARMGDFTLEPKFDCHILQGRAFTAEEVNNGAFDLYLTREDNQWLGDRPIVRVVLDDQERAALDLAQAETAAAQAEADAARLKAELAAAKTAAEAAEAAAKAQTEAEQKAKDGESTETTTEVAPVKNRGGRPKKAPDTDGAPKSNGGRRKKQQQ